MALRLPVADSPLAPAESRFAASGGQSLPPAWYAAAKRVLDVTVALLVLIAALPVVLVITVMVAVDSRGPAIFRQTRIGKHGRPFVLYKFRTMICDAEVRLAEMPEYLTRPDPVFKLKDDPRITRVGRALRRLSLDELPQLLNVLKGEMSLVGPRPPLPAEVVRYTPRQRGRLAVLPGMTGLWQVSGRSEVPFAEWVELDLTYIERRSLWFDIRILLRTIPSVLSGRGAY